MFYVQINIHHNSVVWLGLKMYFIKFIYLLKPNKKFRQKTSQSEYV